MVVEPTSMRPPAMLLRLRNVPILKQLRMEEALFRADARSWLITNEWSAEGGLCTLSGAKRQPEEASAVVLGISGKPAELVDVERTAAAGIPLIKRFTGGGTVICDTDTLFVSLIAAEDALAEVRPYPEPILAWTSDLYAEALGRCGVHGFATHANDYCIGDRKFGGNAQSISGRRWLHHTSLLWDYDPERMSLLQMPSRRPAYRADRTHGEFVRGLAASGVPDRAQFLDAIVASASERLDLSEVGADAVEAALSAPHRKTTCEL